MKKDALQLAAEWRGWRLASKPTGTEMHAVVAREINGQLKDRPASPRTLLSHTLYIYALTRYPHACAHSARMIYSHISTFTLLP